MIRYFVSYAHSRGFGNAVIALTLPIRSYDDIVLVARMIEDSNGSSGVSVLFWRPFETAQTGTEEV